MVVALETLTDGRQSFAIQVLFSALPAIFAIDNYNRKFLTLSEFICQLEDTVRRRHGHGNGWVKFDGKTITYSRINETEIVTWNVQTQIVTYLGFAAGVVLLLLQEMGLEITTN